MVPSRRLVHRRLYSHLHLHRSCLLADLAQGVLPFPVVGMPEDMEHLSDSVILVDSIVLEAGSFEEARSLPLLLTRS